MTFQQLNYIMEIYRTGSITKTAENLFITRPSVSLSLRNLEAELGYPIFTRTQRGLVPTAQGKLFLEYASRICEAQRLINNIGENKRNRIEIAAVSYEPVNRAAIRFLQENAQQKDIAFSIKSRYQDAYQMLTYFELDAVITSRFETDKDFYDIRNNFTCKELRKIPVVIVIGPEHHLYQKKDLKAHDFDNEVLLDTPTGALSKSSFIKEYIKIDPKRAIIADNASLKNQLIEKGIGYSIRKMPSEKTIKQYGFRCIALEGVYQKLLCVTNPLRPLTPDVQRFLDILDEELANHHDIIPSEVIGR